MGLGGCVSLSPSLGLILLGSIYRGYDAVEPTRRPEDEGLSLDPRGEVVWGSTELRAQSSSKTKTKQNNIPKTKTTNKQTTTPKNKEKEDRKRKLERRRGSLQGWAGLPHTPTQVSI